MLIALKYNKFNEVVDLKSSSTLVVNEHDIDVIKGDVVVRMDAGTPPKRIAQTATLL